MVVLRILSLIAELLFFCKDCFGAAEELADTIGCAVIEGCGAVLRRKSISDSSSLLGFNVATSTRSSSLSSKVYGSRTLRCFRFGIASLAMDCDKEIVKVPVLMPFVLGPGFALLDLSKRAVCELVDDCTDRDTAELFWVLAAVLFWVPTTFRAST
jgi:hypothetical protein